MSKIKAEYWDAIEASEPETVEPVLFFNELINKQLNELEKKD